MPKQLLNFKGLFGDHHQPFDQLAIHHESLRIRSAIYNFEIREHLHTDLFQLFLILEGGGILISLDRKIPIETPCALLIPNNVLHGFVFTSEVRGDVFTLSEFQFDKLIKNAPALFSNFEQLRQITFDTNHSELSELIDLKNKIVKEIGERDNATDFNLSLLFQLLLVSLYRFEKVRKAEVISTNDRTLHHFQNFIKLIKQHIHVNKSVQFYAAKMNITTVHLNRICKAIGQKTALQIVHEYVIKEAKKYLSNTTYSIAEVAYFLDFKNPAHFTKFFKKLVGITPSSYRKNHG